MRRAKTSLFKLPYRQSPGSFRQVYWDNYDYRKEVMRILPPPLALRFSHTGESEGLVMKHKGPWEGGWARIGEGEIRAPSRS